MISDDYEEHHEEIDSASEVQVYEGIMLILLETKRIHF